MHLCYVMKELQFNFKLSYFIKHKKLFPFNLRPFIYFEVYPQIHHY